MKISALLNDRQDASKSKASVPPLVHVQPLACNGSSLVSPTVQPISTTDLSPYPVSPLGWQSYPSPRSTPQLLDPIADDRWASLINEAVKLEPIVPTEKKSFPSAESSQLSFDTWSNSSKRSSVDSKKDPSSLICPVKGCGKTFSRTQNLTSHLSVHSGEKPHACESEGCQARFRRRQDLLRHIRSIHEPISSRPYACSSADCFMRFARADGLAAHEKKCGLKSSLKVNRKKKTAYAGTSFGTNIVN